MRHALIFSLLLLGLVILATGAAVWEFTPYVVGGGFAIVVCYLLFKVLWVISKDLDRRMG